MAGPTEFVLQEAVFAAMRAEVAGWAPEEACGMAAGRPGEAERTFPVANRLHSATRFEMDPLEQLRGLQQIEAAGLELVAIYHSHPHGPPHPSPTDVEEFAYPGVVYLIWSAEPGADPAGWTVRAFDMDITPAREIPIVLR